MTSPARRSTILRLGSLLLIGLGCGGCTHVVTQNAPYYVDGPSQLAPPQGELPRGTKVLVIRNTGTYSRVLTANFIDAYVWNNSLMELEDWWAAQRAQDRPPDAAQQPDDRTPPYE